MQQITAGFSFKFHNPPTTLAKLRDILASVDKGNRFFDEHYEVGLVLQEFVRGPKIYKNPHYMWYVRDLIRTLVAMIDSFCPDNLYFGKKYGSQDEYGFWPAR